MGGEDTEKLKWPTSFTVTVWGWWQVQQGKGDIFSRPFCKAETQAFPLSLRGTVKTAAVLVTGFLEALYSHVDTNYQNFPLPSFLPTLAQSK